MRLGVRAKEGLVVTALALLVVGAATAAHVAQLSRVVLEEASRQAELTARQIYAQSGRAISRAPGVPPKQALQRDGDLRGLLEAAVGYSPHLLYAQVTDSSGRVLLHTEAAREGAEAPARPTIGTLQALDPVRRFLALYQGAQTYEYELPLRLNDAPFGSIRLGLSSTLLRRELAASLRQSLVVAGAALVMAWVLAMILTGIVGRRVRALAGEVDRIRRGEFDTLAPALGGGDEFQELSERLRQLGQELQADRNAAFGGQGTLPQVQSLVTYSAKLAALGRLTSGVAHEVKNPLNAMMIHLELLRERLGATPADVQQSLEVIGSEIRRLDRVVQGFLRFMRPQELTLKRIDLHALIASVVALLEAEWVPRGVRMVLEPAPALPELQGDEELLRHAFLNILQNAAQAMPAGGTITIRLDAHGQSVRAVVVDEGVGISPEDMDKVFRLYYTTKPDGSGIGLALVYRIVQLHDGTVQISSEQGRGTTVTVTVPVR